MNEKKHERFIRIVERRMDVLTNDFEKLGNCASKVSLTILKKRSCVLWRSWSGRLRCCVNALPERRALLFPWMPIHPSNRKFVQRQFR